MIKFVYSYASAIFTIDLIILNQMT